MTKKASSKKKPIKADEVELVPDAWPRFERFIKQVAKAGPQPRKQRGGISEGMTTPSRSKTKPSRKGRPH